jgi:hypothetical protein
MRRDCSPIPHFCIRKLTYALRVLIARTASFRRLPLYHTELARTQFGNPWIASPIRTLAVAPTDNGRRRTGHRHEAARSASRGARDGCVECRKRLVVHRGRATPARAAYHARPTARAPERRRCGALRAARIPSARRRLRRRTAGAGTGRRHQDVRRAQLAPGPLTTAVRGRGARDGLRRAAGWAVVAPWPRHGRQRGRRIARGITARTHAALVARAWSSRRTPCAPSRRTWQATNDNGSPTNSWSS